MAAIEDDAAADGAKDLKLLHSLLGGLLSVVATAIATDVSIMLRSLRSRQIRNKQRGWLESEEGRKMTEVHKSLLAYKERDALLAAIEKNQVMFDMITLTGELSYCIKWQLFYVLNCSVCRACICMVAYAICECFGRTELPD